MKIRSTLGAGLAVAAVATTAMGVGASAFASPADGSWNTKLGDYGTSTEGWAVSGDGSTAYALVSGTYDADTQTSTPATVVPVDLATGTASDPAAIPASYTVGFAASGDSAAVAGYDDSNVSTVWTVTDGQVGAIALQGADGANIMVNGLTSTPTGFLAVGASDNCFESWTWAPGDTTATAADPICNDNVSYMPFAIATQPGSGTTYAAVALEDGDNPSTYQLWNLSDSSADPIALPSSWTGIDGLSVAADGTVYAAGDNANADDDTLEIASMAPGGTTLTAPRSTGLYPSQAQLGAVGDKLWIGTWSGIGVLDTTSTTSYTSDSPVPTLNTDSGSPQNFLATDDADYLLLPSDAAYTDADSNTAPGLLKVVAPAAPAPKAVVSGTKATVTWNAATDGGTAVTSGTVTVTDTTTDKQVSTLTRGIDGTSASTTVGSLTPGHTYSFAVTQSNGFFTSTSGTASATVPLPATAKPSKIAVVGTPEAGKKLTIKTTGAWTSGAKLTYAWYSGTKKVGTASSYTAKSTDVGSKIKVVVTGIAAGHTSSSITSASVGPVVKPVYKVPHRPTITGTPKIGKTLTAHITGLPKGATVKYLWAADFGQYGGPVGKLSSKNTLKLTKSVKGARMEVIAVVSVPGYSAGSAFSGLTGVVK